MSDKLEDKKEIENPSAARPVFSFRRMSGMDQVVLLNDEEWRELDKLDPKLWMALSCPTKGLEYDADTLAILDTDNDGRVRASEVKDAVAWICARVRHPSSLCQESDEIFLENIRDDTDEGKNLASALRMIARQNSMAENEPVNLAMLEKVLAEAAGYPFNGDGVVPPDSAPETPDNAKSADMRAYILTGLSIVGGKRDVSGKPGLDADLAAELDKRLKAVLDWRALVKKAKLPLGEKTGEAWDIISRLTPKLDDYFNRCHMAAFAPETVPLLNGEKLLQETGAGETGAPGSSITPDILASLPLSKVNAMAELDLETGLNPAFADDISKLRGLLGLMPGLGKEPKSLAEKTWETIKDNFANYAEILAKKPGWNPPPDDAEHVDLEGLPPLALAPADDSLKRDFLPLDPNGVLEGMDDAQIEKLLAPEYSGGFRELVEKDLAAPALASFQDLRKLALLHGHLYTFMMNFLSFIDFYDPGKKAIFQAGTLYLDSRGCLLCVPVTDLDTHARLAEQSHLCLIYCACTRKEADGAESSATIAAALTEGNLASLIDGRHGLFIDNDGREWDTTIIKIIHNPISLREAMWAPYIRVYNMVGEQIQKFVASKKDAVADATGKAVTSVASGEKPAGQGFDFAKGAGIFAAVSVAISVLSAAFAYIAHSIASLGWWWPLAIIVVFICISGPSMLLAWFKLRRRSLGPLLDASGWAVNKGAPINMIMGAALTTIGKIPANAKRDLNDPYGLPAIIKARKRRLGCLLTLLFIIAVAIGGFVCYCYLFGQPEWLVHYRKLLGI